MITPARIRRIARPDEGSRAVMECGRRPAKARGQKADGATRDEYAWGEGQLGTTTGMLTHGPRTHCFYIAVLLYSCAAYA